MSYEKEGDCGLGLGNGIIKSVIFLYVYIISELPNRI